MKCAVKCVNVANMEERNDHVPYYSQVLTEVTRPWSEHMLTNTPAMAIGIARTTKGFNSKGPGPMALIFFPTIKLVILVMSTKFQVSR